MTKTLWEDEEVVWLDAIRQALSTWSGPAIERVWIYMSNEAPMLLVNVDDCESPPKGARISVELESFLADLEEHSRGFFLSMDLPVLKKAIKRFMPDAWSANANAKDPAKLRAQLLRESAYWDDDEDTIEAGMEEAALADLTGARNLAEVIWVYRLAGQLERERPGVVVRAAIHDELEEVDKRLWKVAQEFLDRPLKDYLAHFGLTATNSP